MNTRVLELIKNPKDITEADIKILASESDKMPYAQSIRALHLYGINLYQPDLYKENLSKTAAYTTDKKILYQFINSEKINKKESQLLPVTTQEKTTVVADNVQNPNLEIPTLDIITEDSKPINEYQPDVIADEVPANPNHEPGENIDITINAVASQENLPIAQEVTIAQTLEPTQNIEIINPEPDPDVAAENIVQEQNSESAINNEAIQTLGQEATEQKESNIIKNDAEENLDQPFSDISATETVVNNEVKDANNESDNSISFSGIQNFLPDVKFSVPKNHRDYLNPPKPTPLQEIKPEDITQKKQYVEQPLKKELVIDEPADTLSFSHIQSFEVESESATPISEEKTEPIEEKNVETQSATAWRPMQISSNTPDALISQKKNAEKPAPIVHQEETEPAKEAKIENITSTKIEEKETPITEEKEPEMPVINVSFFGTDVSKIEEKKPEKPLQKEKESPQKTEDSNVGRFINTWQNWLKLDRKNDAEDPAKIKDKIIENFIENNPKISQLKEDISYVVKEKKDDISHLMTETLAKLYTEQKLYTKAIKAYEILSDKHPEKKSYFAGKIEEIKDFRKS